MKLDSSLARKRAPYANSFGLPRRFIGVFSTTPAVISASCAAIIGVYTMPGCKEFTRMPYSAYDIAAFLHMYRTDDLLVLLAEISVVTSYLHIVAIFMYATYNH